MILTRQPDPEPVDEWAADDLDALTALIGAYAYSVAEQTIDGVFEALGITEGSMVWEAISGRMRERLGKIPDKVAAGMVDHYRQQLAEAERADGWEVERVILERMRGNPAARRGS